MTELARAHGLTVEPGRNVIEVRAPGQHKGHAVQTLVKEQSAGGFLYAGDDLGDVEAFEAVAELREQGLATLLVCAASDEQAALVADWPTCRRRARRVLEPPAPGLDRPTPRGSRS